MATKSKKSADVGVVGRLASKGEEATGRFMEALGKNHLVTDALAKAMSAKGRLDAGSKAALGQMGLAPLDEVKDLRKQVATLERRLAKLEGSGAKASSAKASGRSTTSSRATAAKPAATKKTTRAKKSAEETASPAAGRAIGGGTARGSR
jgi:hypothetical protein